MMYQLDKNNELPGGENDRNGHPCPVIVGSDIKIEKDYFAGVGFVFGEEIKLIYTDSNGEIVMEKEI